MGSFLDQGLRFTCQSGCRYCCGVEPGYVFLTRDDITRLCDHLHLRQQEFLRTYCRKVSMGSISYVSLRERENNDCEFLIETGCSVYPARPVQCATYPFWSTILTDAATWEEEKSWCPGIGKGALHTKDEIESLLAMRRGVEPAVWEEMVF
ncbi:MAG: YkgJ family cysteine cluster protein [Sphaerochaetaceae bacterium]|nr:YkgJ family cysteine cluster protein [Sphaerochaetaceae bacterium]MDD3941428.1 YkgJ family cysteine cluster protein [Sphaerochaetaceae bacterium]MDX9938627.1 YkgJ family cysteine cluster protein [Sphaerochaetaceae bacterium]